MSSTIRVGTRASALARTQTETVTTALIDRGLDVTVVPMTSAGDRSTASLSSLGGTGVFAAALRSALLEGQCDAVVHSLKDLPTAPHPGLRIAATPARGNPADALCARDGLTLRTLPAGAVVGTGSPRRAAQLRLSRRDLQVRDIRGNIDTRLGFVTSGELDAVVLAAAGLHRIDRADAITDLLPVDVWPGAPGQGALAVEVRDGADAGLLSALAEIHDEHTWAAVSAERALLATLEAGCAAPVGAHARVEGGVLVLAGAAYHPEGRTFYSAQARGDLADADVLGGEVAQVLLQSGADAWLGTS